MFGFWYALETPCVSNTQIFNLMCRRSRMLVRVYVNDEIFCFVPVWLRRRSASMEVGPL